MLLNNGLNRLFKRKRCLYFFLRLSKCSQAFSSSSVSRTITLRFFERIQGFGIADALQFMRQPNIILFLKFLYFDSVLSGSGIIVAVHLSTQVVGHLLQSLRRKNIWGPICTVFQVSSWNGVAPSMTRFERKFNRSTLSLYPCGSLLLRSSKLAWLTTRKSAPLRKVLFLLDTRKAMKSVIKRRMRTKRLGNK